ncbi:3-isopropylmalate dehydratase [bacterium]|nr:3-isopropylmalate dehydratase [bacterium]
MIIKGRVIAVLPENVDTDVIFPGRYLNVTDKEKTKDYLFDLSYPELKNEIKEGDIIVAGRNFGCGSSREQATTALKYAGIKAVIAPSFARIFYRNSLNQALAPIISKEAPSSINKGDEVEINLETGTIKNLTSGKEMPAAKLDSKAIELLTAGGLIPRLKAKYS